MEFLLVDIAQIPNAEWSGPERCIHEEIFVIEQKISYKRTRYVIQVYISGHIQSGTKLWVTSPFRPTLGHPSTAAPWKNSLSSEQIRLWSLWRFSLASWFPLGIWPLSAPNSGPEHQFELSESTNVYYAHSKRP